MIKYRSVSKEFPDGTRAVDDFSLILPSHETTVFLGSSGCGKTTLLRMVDRMVDPTAGSVLIDDEDVAKSAPVELRRRIGYVMQNAGLLPAPHGRPQHRDGAAADRRVEGRGARARARADGRRRPRPLDGGPLPLAALGRPAAARGRRARALAPNPNILLMDEPFGAVDPIVRRELQREVIRLRERFGTTIVFVTHDVDEAFALGHRVVILERGGRVAQLGTPDEDLGDPANDFVASFIGADRADRELRLEETPDGTLVVDGRGRPLGRLDGTGAGR